jgi:hypothetical protein
MANYLLPCSVEESITRKRKRTWEHDKLERGTSRVEKRNETVTFGRRSIFGPLIKAMLDSIGFSRGWNRISGDEKMSMYGILTLPLLIAYKYPFHLSQLYLRTQTRTKLLDKTSVQPLTIHHHNHFRKTFISKFRSAGLGT